MFNRLKNLGENIEKELAVYRRVLKHPRTPRAARILLAAAIGYLLMPIDVIPDWIPVIGLLDDVIIVPALVFLALRLIPQDVVDECRLRRTRDTKADSQAARSSQNCSKRRGTGGKWR